MGPTEVRAPKRADGGEQADRSRIGRRSRGFPKRDFRQLNPAPTSGWRTPVASAAWDSIKDVSIVMLAIAVVVGVAWRYKLAWQAEQRRKAEIAAAR